MPELPYPMLSAEDALRRVLAQTPVLLPTRVPFRQSQGRVLAEAVVTVEVTEERDGQVVIGQQVRRGTASAPWAGMCGAGLPRGATANTGRRLPAIRLPAASSL